MTSQPHDTHQATVSPVECFRPLTHDGVLTVLGFPKLPLSWLCQGSLGTQNTVPPSPQLMQQGSIEEVGSALFKGRTENLETDFKF